MDTLRAHAELKYRHGGNEASSRGNKVAAWSEGAPRGNEDTDRGNDAVKGEDDLTGVAHGRQRVAYEGGEPRLHDCLCPIQATSLQRSVARMTRNE